MMPDELNAQWTIESAFLRVASPESVYNWIRERAPKESVHETEVPDALLKSLHDRQDPLINLALAQFCVSPAMLKELYREGDEPLKCAVLSNRFLGSVFWMPSSDYLFTEEEHQAFAKAASPPLLEVYLCNPSLDPEILEALFLRKAPFAEIGEERWKQCILYASANPRLHHDYPHRRFAYSDGWSDYKHGTPMTAAWRLLDILPATKEWAAVLGRLYEKMLYRGVPREIPEAPREHQEAEHNQEWFWEQVRSFSERSRPVELRFLQEGLQKWKSEEETGEQIWNYFGELRRTIASRVSIHDNDIRALLRDHADVFVRKGFYQQFEPWKSEDVRTAFERDKKEFIEAAIENPWFYRRGHTAVRRALYALVHDDEVLKDTDAEILRSRYHALGGYWTQKDPQAFTFDEDELASAVDEDTEETRGRDGRSELASIGERVGEVIHSASRKDGTAADVISATARLRDALEELEQKYKEQRAEVLEMLRTRLDLLGQAQRSNTQLLLWALIIGFAIMLYLTR